MSRKKKDKKNKGLAQHTDYCKCYDCNDGVINTDKKGEKEIIAKEIKKTTALTSPPEIFKHAKSCMCDSCTAPTNKPTFDHTIHCICYKCKDSKMGGTGKSTTTNSYSYTPCHKGNVFVFSKDGISVYGAGNMKDAEPNKVDLVIDLDRNVKAATWASDLPKHFKSRLRATSNVRVLDLFIKDMHAPEHVTAEFWVDFWQDLVAEAKKLGGKLKVLVMCQGGHGRTGVVITSLIMASAYNKKNIPEDVHPVGWLRKQYCDSAVESLRQTDYLTKIWGLRFVSASKDSTKTSFHNKGSTDTNGSGTKKDDVVPDEEIPNADSKCYSCGKKRESRNRILFSADVKEFECDNCFGIRADNDEEDEEEANEPETEDTGYDNTEPCDGTDCSDSYNEMSDSWSTIHTYNRGCEADGWECGGSACGFHSNAMSKGFVHTYEDGCKAKEGAIHTRVNEMTDKEYAIWAETLG